MTRLRFSITNRLMLAFTAVVLATSFMIYYGAEFGLNRVRDTENSARMRFLADAIALGIRNFVVTNDKALIGEVVSEVLNRNFNPEIVVTRCTVFNNRKEKVFVYSDPPPAGAVVKPVVSKVVNPMSGSRKAIGAIRLEYYTRDALESEKNNQIITIGNTLAAMFQVFYKNKSLFQARELVDAVRGDRNILYCLIVGSDGQVHFSYHGAGASLEKELDKAKQRRAMSVSHARPIVIQNISESAVWGRVIEVSILIEQGDTQLGVVRVGYSLKSWADQLARAKLMMSLLITGFTLFAIALSFYLSRTISTPVVRLTRVAAGVADAAPGKEFDLAGAEGDIRRLSASFEEIATRLRRRRDEVGNLAEAFSHMAQSLEGRLRELKQAYQKMSQADRLFAMGQLSAGIAHEINNPLAIISTYVQIIAKRKDIDDELRGEIRIISEEIDRIAEKVQDLLSFAQDSEVKFSEEDLHELVRRTLKLMRHQMKKHNIEIVEDFCCEGGPLPVHMDANKMKQVVLNLALNAAQAMGESGGTLTVSTGEQNGGARLSIRDTGHGIEPDDLPRIFDPFFTRRRVGEGTGMGLAITYSIVKAHGGDIEVSSTPGQGTEFIISLPG